MVILLKHIAGNAILGLNLPGSCGSCTAGIIFVSIFVDYKIKLIKRD